MSDGKERRQAATPEEIWAILREVSESQRQTDRLIAEVAEGQKEMRLQMQETDRRMRQTDVRLKKLDDLFNGQWGKLMEALVDGELIELLNGRDIEVMRTVTSVKQKRGGQTVSEIDILAVNGREVVAVEVKTTLKVRDVDRFVERLRNVGELLPEYRDRKAYGAVAYLKADESSDEYAERQGLFVIRATGGSASITNRKDFRPRVFG